MGTLGLVGVLVGALGVVAIIYAVMQKLKAGRLAKTPFAKTGDVANNGAAVSDPKGAVSVEGQVNCPQPLIAPASGRECLYYELKVVGEWKDGDEKKKKDYVDEKCAAGFTLDDGSGAVLIDAREGGDFDEETSYDETKKEGFFSDLRAAVGREKPIMFGNYEFYSGVSKANKFTCTETIVPVQPKLFALGVHREGVITAPKWRSLILSTKGRDALMGSTAKAAKFSFIGGGSAVGVGAILAVIGLLITPAKADMPAKDAPPPTAAIGAAKATEKAAAKEADSEERNEKRANAPAMRLHRLSKWHLSVRAPLSATITTSGSRSARISAGGCDVQFHRMPRFMRTRMYKTYKGVSERDSHLVKWNDKELTSRGFVLSSKLDYSSMKVTRLYTGRVIGRKLFVCSAFARNASQAACQRSVCDSLSR
ncbi:MAG: hypothetical protein KC503_30800 [Myxococcales bacterium]|nr:hypothetical protein [Myxococcales bacterium]